MESMKLKQYKTELEAIDSELSSLPAGRLVKRGNFYCQALNDRKENGISNDTCLIRSLCRKRFLLMRKKQLSHNLSIIARSMDRLDHVTGEEMLRTLPSSYQEVPEDYFFDPNVLTWQASAYRKNTYMKENLNYSSNNGTRVRSKSEVLIANLLEEYRLPYRYDAEMKLGTKTIYPDFIVKNPFNGKTVIWEHFGALNESGYVEKMNQKMKLYFKQGLIPFETLIYTFEFDLMDARRLKGLVGQLTGLN